MPDGGVVPRVGAIPVTLRGFPPSCVFTVACLVFLIAVQRIEELRISTTVALF